jgi:hypothetical protein
MKYILLPIGIGFVVGLCLYAAGVRAEEVRGLSVVNTLFFNEGPYGSTNVTKIYDYDNGVVCYVSDGYRSGGISCLKNTP